MTVQMNVAIRAGAVSLSAATEIGDDELPVKIRCEVGVRPDHEVVYLREKVRATVDTWRLDRAQESTTAEAWPVGTPLALIPADADPTGETTLHLAHPVAANAYQVDLQGCYRRLKIGSEILHEAQLVGEPEPGYTFRFDRVLRGQEGTTEAAHAAGSTVTVLGPGEI